MRGTLVVVSITVLATAVGCSSRSSRQPARPAPVATSITHAPSTTANAGGWTTPVNETSFSGSPPGPGSLAPRAAAPGTVAVTPRQPAPPSTWSQQPPVMDDFPQPPVVDEFPAAPAQMPPADMPAEPTWTPPAPIDAPAPVDAPAPLEAPAPVDMPAPVEDATNAANALKDPAAAASSYAKKGFQVFEQDGRLWVFRDGSDDLAAFLKDGEPAKSVTSIGTGPGGMSMRSGDMQTIKDFLAAP